MTMISKTNLIRTFISAPTQLNIFYMNRAILFLSKENMTKRKKVLQISQIEAYSKHTTAFMNSDYYYHKKSFFC